VTEGFTVSASFTVLDMEPEQLAKASDELMEQLLALEEAGCGIHSSAVSVDLGERSVELEVAVDGSEEGVVIAVARSCIRAAIHATGGATPDWDRAPAAVEPELLPA